jgi:hypothetical protein
VTRWQLLPMALLLTVFPGVSMACTAMESCCSGIIPIAVQPNPGVIFEAGCSQVYILKEAGGTGSQATYRAVVLDSCKVGACAGMSPGAANTFQCLMENGFGCCVDVGACLRNKSGNMSGPVKSAIATRFSRDTDQRPELCYSEYHGNGQRVVTVPITGTLGGSGCAGYQVFYFASFFIRRIPGNGDQNFITAEFLSSDVTAARSSSWGRLKTIYR